MSGDTDGPGAVTLVVRRLIGASPEFLFGAWTDAHQLVRWWGPRGVTCEDAEIDLRIGGAYKIANRLPDGRLVVISGAFDLIDPPKRIGYSWCVDPGPAEHSRVVVCFQARGDQTEVIVTHERIRSQAARQDHEHGWNGCLDGMRAYAERGDGARPGA